MDWLGPGEDKPNDPPKPTDEEDKDNEGEGGGGGGDGFFGLGAVVEKKEDGDGDAGGEGVNESDGLFGLGDAGESGSGEEKKEEEAADASGGGGEDPGDAEKKEDGEGKGEEEEAADPPGGDETGGEDTGAVGGDDDATGGGEGEEAGKETEDPPGGEDDAGTAGGGDDADGSKEKEDEPQEDENEEGQREGEPTDGSNRSGDVTPRGARTTGADKSFVADSANGSQRRDSNGDARRSRTEDEAPSLADENFGGGETNESSGGDGATEAGASEEPPSSQSLSFYLEGLPSTCPVVYIVGPQPPDSSFQGQTKAPSVFEGQYLDALKKAVMASGAVVVASGHPDSFVNLGPEVPAVIVCLQKKYSGQRPLSSSQRVLLHDGKAWGDEVNAKVATARELIRGGSKIQRWQKVVVLLSPFCSQCSAAELRKLTPTGWPMVMIGTGSDDPYSHRGGILQHCDEFRQWRLRGSGRCRVEIFPPQVPPRELAGWLRFFLVF